MEGKELGEKLMSEKMENEIGKEGGNRERDLITVGSEGIKREMRKTCVIPPLSVNLERWCVRVMLHSSDVDGFVVMSCAG